MLTGETGAGKSILLDALGLALGARADSGLVRRDRRRRSSPRNFRPRTTTPPGAFSTSRGSGREETLVLRRSLSPDGRSRAFVNDQPVGVAFLKQLGDTLVEVQGQFEQRGLLDTATHRTLLDAFGGHSDSLAAVEAAWRAWRAATRRAMPPTRCRPRRAPMRIFCAMPSRSWPRWTRSRPRRRLSPKSVPASRAAKS